MQRILIIGATSSVAGELARLYLAQGDQLYLLARNEQKLAPLLREWGSSVLGSACLDFEELDANAQVIEEAYACCGWFDLIVIAHGYLGDQMKSETHFEEAYRQISVNYLSVVAQLVALTKQFETFPNRSAQVAVISSVAGDRGRPRNYTYGSAKGALTLYLQGLRSRYWGRIHWTTIKLGPVDSPMTVDHEKNVFFTTSPQAAQGIQRAIHRKRAEVYVPWRWSSIMTLVRMLPEPLFQKFSFLSGR